MSSRPALPPLFVSHGSPMTALEPGALGPLLQRLGRAIEALAGARPRAVLAVSAHTLAREPVLLGAARHAAVYDFGGFDPRLRTLHYDAPGDPALADAVRQRLQGAGWAAHATDAGGLDHGIWTPLRWLFPDAAVPVLPLAWPADAAPARLVALGRALAPLTADGVLVLATGSITHNLARVFTAGGIVPVDAPPTPESVAFREWFAARGAAGDLDALLDWRRRAPHAALMHPSDEHLLPFFVAAGAGWSPAAPLTAAAVDRSEGASGIGGVGGAGGAGGIGGVGGVGGVGGAGGAGAPAGDGGAAGNAQQALRLHAGTTHGDLGMDAYAFGPQAAALARALTLER